MRMGELLASFAMDWAQKKKRKKKKISRSECQTVRAPFGVPVNDQTFAGYSSIATAAADER